MRMVMDLELSQELLAVLPTDPFEQLDIARRIAAKAMVARVSELEAQSGKLRQNLDEKENTIRDLQQHIFQLEHSLEETTARLSNALDDQAKLSSEKNALMVTVKKLNRDVMKLETFKRTLMQSLQEEEEQQDDSGKIARDSTGSLAKGQQDSDMYSSRPQSILDDGSGTMSSKPSNSKTTTWQSVSDLALVPSSQENAHTDGEVKSGDQKVLSLTSNELTPRLTPSGSPKRHSTAGSPFRQPVSGSPRWHSASDSRFSLPAHHATAPNSPPRISSFPVRTPRIDGKEFFRQARNRLSYEQFSAFLVNIKELNAHRQTREETLRKADEIFGPENKDLYLSFDGLLSRHLHS